MLIFASGYAQSSKLKKVSILVKDGKQTNHHYVQIVALAAGATWMKVGESSQFDKSVWVRFKPHIKVHLSSGDGQKEIMGQFKDDKGNISPVVTTSVLLDTQPPIEPFVQFDSPSGFHTDLNSMKIGVILMAHDAKYYKVSNTSNFSMLKWQLYRNDYIEWELEKGDDGIRRVFVQFKDDAGNVSHIVKDEIIVDRMPPMGVSVNINNSSRITSMQDKVVRLKFTAIEADSMRIAQSEHELEKKKWVSYINADTLTLNEGDGEKKVFAQFKDKAGNLSIIVQDNIVLDLTPPENLSIQINKGEKITDNDEGKVHLSIHAEGAMFMKISNNPAFQGANWRPYIPEVRHWKLGDTRNGVKKVFVKFKDKAGNVSSAVSASIELKIGS
ncbi:hypothetical protein GCM10023331_11000 [Algivirga pacifica]|uniref:BACON domain-containing protein n=2 Tax=Algivirga pacifica TaxID=1162670 RepID=A0ABP9D5H1_9BACT